MSSTLSVLFTSLPKFFPSRPVHLYLVKAVLPFSALTFFVFTLLLLSPAVHAQGSWQDGWTVTDSAGNAISPSSDGSYTLSTLPTGSATNTFPDSMTKQALASPYASSNGGTIDKSWAIDCYRPNALDARHNLGLSYLFGGAPPPTPLALLSLDGFAQNYAVSTNPAGWFYLYYPYDYPDPNYQSYVPVVGTSHAEAKGTLLLYFTYAPTWVGGGAPTSQPNPPPYVNLLLTTSLSSSAAVTFTDTYVGNDGLGGRTASATVSVPAFSETSSAQASSGGAPALLSQVGQPVRGYHLVRAALQGSVAEVYLDSEVKVDAESPLCSNDFDDEPSSPIVSHTNSEAIATLSATARQDNREVSISCPTIDDPQSYYKGPTDANHPNGKWTHIRDTTGAISTDSAVSPPLTQPGAPTSSWTAGASMLGQAGSFQNPVFAWSLSGPTSLSASGNTSHTQLSVQFPVSSTNTALNQQSTVRLDVTDSDGATGANTFAVNWHYPYENWQASGGQYQNSPLAFPSAGPQAVNGQVSIPVSSAESGISWNVAGKVGGGFLTTGAAVVAVVQPETDPIIIGALTAFGYTLSVLDPPPTPQPLIEQGTPGQFQTDVGTQISINHGNTDGIFLPSRPRMDPALAAMVSASGNYGSYTSDQGGSLTFDATAYREQLGQNYTGDGYDQHGYVGPAAGSVNRPGHWQYVWDWFWTSTGPPQSH